MAKTTFKTNPVALETLLRQCGEGKIQLPDFQRSWVWAEDRIMSLIASISSAFPIGALMTLESKSGSTIFARRPVQGAPASAHIQKAVARPEHEFAADHVQLGFLRIG